MSRQSHYIADEAAELLLRTMLLTPRGWLHHRGLFGKLEGALEDSECMVHALRGGPVRPPHTAAEALSEPMHGTLRGYSRVPRAPSQD